MGDTVLRESAGEKLQIPVRDQPPADLASRSGSVTLSDASLIYERPAADARVVARVSGGPVELSAQANTADFVRVDIGEGRPGWVKSSALASGRPAGKGKLSDVLAHMPPNLQVNYGGALVTRSDTLKLDGTVTDDTRVRDVFVYVGSRKVFYQSNRGAKDATAEKFATSLPLRPGINFVMVVARESNDVASRKSFIVRRDAADGSLLETPKGDDDDDMFHAASED